MSSSQTHDPAIFMLFGVSIAAAREQPNHDLGALFPVPPRQVSPPAYWAWRATSRGVGVRGELLIALGGKLARKILSTDQAATRELDAQALEQILIGHVMAVCGEANQIFRPLNLSDYGIDGEVEFKDANGKASGKKSPDRVRR